MPIKVPTITAWYKDNMVLVDRDVAAELGILNGHRIRTDKELYYILAQSITMTIAKLSIELAMNEE